MNRIYNGGSNKTKTSRMAIKMNRLRLRLGRMQLDKIWPKTVHASHNSWFLGWEAERGTLRRR